MAKVSSTAKRSTRKSTTRKSAKKAAAKKTPAQKPKPKSTPKPKDPSRQVGQRNEKGKVEISFRLNKEEAIENYRDKIVSEWDIMEELKDVNDQYKEVFKDVQNKPRIKWEDNYYIENVTKLLDGRSKNLFKLLDKIVPTFTHEDVNAALETAQHGANNFDANAIRAEGFDKLAKVVGAK